MKANIHPKWYKSAKITCACGNTFTVGASYPELTVEICSNCHPFYTGQMKFVDAAGRVDAFRSKMKLAKSHVVSKTERRKIKKQEKLSRELDRPESLETLRKNK
jgi:large subunit ribosomal protein L31